MGGREADYARLDVMCFTAAGLVVAKTLACMLSVSLSDQAAR